MAFIDFPSQLLQLAHKTYWGEYAWKANDVPTVLEFASANNLVILGGDVITPLDEYTCDNWYYDISYSQTIKENIQSSITQTQQYINAYIQRNGDVFPIHFITK